MLYVIALQWVVIQECTSKSQTPPWFLQKEKRVCLCERVLSGPESLIWCSWAGKHSPKVAWPQHRGSESKPVHQACLWCSLNPQGFCCSGHAAFLSAVVILCDLHFFSCLKCSCLIRSWFCLSCLLFKYRYSLTKSRWQELKGLILPIIISFYSESSFLSVSGSVLSLASSVNFHAKYS